MLIVTSDRKYVINMDSVEHIETEKMDDGNFAIKFRCHSFTVTWGTYESEDVAKVALQRILKAYEKKRKVFYFKGDKKED